MTIALIQRNFEDSLRTLLAEDPTLFAPLRLEVGRHSDENIDRLQPRAQPTTVEITHGTRTYRFYLEARRRSAPSVVRPALHHLQGLSISGAYPMLAVPYLSSALVAMLEETATSAIDLNGNYFIVTPELVAIRLDRPNRFPESTPIRNIYAGNSSIVGRFFLSELGPFQQVNEIAAGIASLGGGVSLSTISKVLAAMTDDLILQRSRSTIQLMQPRRLLERLRSAYVRPKVCTTMRLQLPTDRSEVEILLNDSFGIDNWIWSGESSAEAYAFTTPSQRRVAYTRVNPNGIAGLLRHENARFYNCELRQTDDKFVFFGRNGAWASRIECYVALWQLDKRERDIATEIESVILEGVEHDA